MSGLKTWKEMPPGGLVDRPGSSEEYATGTWRSIKPEWDEAKCIHCYRCFQFCPDASIIIEHGKVAGINYKFCKGCGICAQECPKQAGAIAMVPERK